MILSDELEGASRRDIILTVRNLAGTQPTLARIDVTYAAYILLHYILLFPCGDYKWYYKMWLW